MYYYNNNQSVIMEALSFLYQDQCLGVDFGIYTA